MSARSCAQVQADLSAYLDDDLDAGLADATRAHLDGCTACRSELDLLRLTVDTLHGLPDLPPPAGILTGVRARLRPEPWYRRLLGGGRWHSGFPLSAAATLLVVFGVSLFVARFPDMPKTVTHDSARQSKTPTAPSSSTSSALESPAKPAPVASPSPAARDKGADRQSARLEPPVTAPKDAAREESLRVENLAAAPSRGSDAFDVLKEQTGASPSSLEKEKKSPGSFAQKADSSAALGRARFAGEQESAPTLTRIVCLLPPDGDTVDDLEEVLRREGAAHIATSELEPPAVREALARYRGKFGSLTAPERGWTVKASVPSSEFTRILDALAGRAGLRILEKPATFAAPKNLGERLDLHITVLR